MKTFRTRKDQRTTYVYYDVCGRKVAELRPGEEGVTEALIAGLHSEDDAFHNLLKRDYYHGLLHIEQFDNDGEEYSADKQACLSDESANPETILIETLEAAERSDAFGAIWDNLTDKQRELIKKKSRGRTNVDIAAEEGCTEAAIRNRLFKIQKHFEKFLR